MNIKTTITLLIVTVVVAGGYLLWQGRRAASNTVTLSGGNDNATVVPATSGGRLTQPPLAGDDVITRVTYSQAAQPTMIFERASDSPVDTPAGKVLWNMIEPVRCRATDWLVNDLILAIKGLGHVSSSRISGPQDAQLQQAGLKPEPRCRIGLTTRSGTTVDVHVGNTIMPGPHTYVYLPDSDTHGSHLYLTADSFQTQLQRPTTTYRDRHLVPFEAEQARALTIREHVQGRVLDYALRKNADGTWSFETPVSAAANAERIEAVVHSISRLWVREWLQERPDNLATFGLAEPRLSITIALRGVDDSADTSKTFVLSNRHPLQAEEVLYVRRDGEEQVGLVNSAVLDELLPDMIRWRDLELLRFDPADVTALTIEQHDTPLSIRRDAAGNGWQVEGTAEAADAQTVNALLMTLSQLDAVSFVDAEESPAARTALSSAAATLQITLQDGRTLRLRIGRATDDSGQRLRFAQTTAGDAIAKIRTRDLQPALQDLKIFRDRTVLSCSPARIEMLELDRRIEGIPGRQTQTFTHDASYKWTMVQPVERAARSTDLATLSKRLADLRAERIVPVAEASALYFSAPDVRVHGRLAAIPVVHTDGIVPPASTPDAASIEVFELTFVKEDGRVFARHDGREDTFEVAVDLHQLLTSEFLSGQVWTFDPQAVVGLSWTKNTRPAPLAFKKQAGRWTYTAEPDLPLNGKRLAAHIDTIHSIKARRFVTFAPASLSEFGLDAPSEEFRIELQDDSTESMLLSNRGPAGASSHYATILGSDTVFVLPARTVERMAIEIAELEAE